MPPKFDKPWYPWNKYAFEKFDREVCSQCKKYQNCNVLQEAYEAKESRGGLQVVHECDGDGVPIPTCTEFDCDWKGAKKCS